VRNNRIEEDAEVVSDWEGQLSVPLDDEGFLRRECPTCEREFKWLPTKNNGGEEMKSAADELTTAADLQYICPYCGVAAPASAWHTRAQVAAMTAILEREVLQPELEKLERTFRDLDRSGGELLRVKGSLKRTPSPPAPDLTAVDDMRRVDFACHATEPLKVLETWDEPVRCLVCGTLSET